MSESICTAAIFSRAAAASPAGESSAGHCVIPDDMEKNIAAVRRSDIILLSFPLYFFGMPSQVKAFLDRCLPLMKPYQGNASDSRPSFHTLRDESLKEKHFVVIS
ncbi:MAG: NAD(P)H-dependent oxidoreductase, partial [Ruminococcus sp.]|nr:NAD(P)H-dependent oxidoreductase [Ruminococcus sp.]